MAEDPTAQVDTVRRLLSDLEDAAVAVDAAGDVVAVHDAAHAGLAPDRERDGVRGTPVEELLGADLPAPGERTELERDTGDGRTVYDANVSAVGSVDGVDAVAVLRDVTERKRSVERVLELERVLRHALRDEMTGVLGRAEYVRDTIEEAGVLAEAHDAADAVVEATADLADLGETAWAVEDVFQPGGTETVEHDIVPVVEDVLAAVEDDHPDVKVDRDLPASAVVEAPATVERAIAAVLEHACERNDAPVPRLTVSVERDDDIVTVEVADNGSGIDATERSMLETGGEPPLRREGGLDRWLAHWVVDAAGGDVTVGENVPRGTVVTVALPAAPP